MVTMIVDTGNPQAVRDRGRRSRCDSTEFSIICVYIFWCSRVEKKLLNLSPGWGLELKLKLGITSHSGRPAFQELFHLV